MFFRPDRHDTTLLAIDVHKKSGETVFYRGKDRQLDRACLTFLSRQCPA
jgi:hypothetical protein